MAYASINIDREQRTGASWVQLIIQSKEKKYLSDQSTRVDEIVRVLAYTHPLIKQPSHTSTELVSTEDHTTARETSSSSPRMKNHVSLSGQDPLLVN